MLASHFDKTKDSASKKQVTFANEDSIELLTENSSSAVGQMLLKEMEEFE